MKHTYALLVLLLALALPSWGQRMVFSGRITEASTGQPVPFASLFVPGTTIGITADAEGRYQLTTTQPIDTLASSALGFLALKKAVGRQEQQTVNFALRSGAVTLSEVVVRPRENPAYVILRRVQTHKPRNDKRQLKAFEFDSYSRLQTSITDLPARLAKRKVIRDMLTLSDSMSKGTGAGISAKALPIFASEILSRVYTQTHPIRKREEIRRRQMRGLGPREGSVLSQILGSSLQDYNFYLNWQNILGKDFISPIADGWKLAYEYELQDSVFVGQDWCYQLAVQPRRAQDLAFTGTIWITADTYALRKVSLTKSPEANINFVSELRIDQELTPPDQGAGLPARVQVKVGVKPADNQAGMLVQFTTINSNFERNHERALAFYDNPIETAANATQIPKDYFDKNRPDSLSLADQTTLAVLDSVRELPSVRSVLDLADVLVNGYKRVGPLDLGPILSTYGFNDIEGHRLRFGFRTTPELSRDWLVRAYAAYGFRDGRFKYGARVNRILERQHWTVLGAEYRHDLDQVALLDNEFGQENPLFDAAARFGRIRGSRPLMRDVSGLSLQTDIIRGFTQKIMVRHQRFTPLYNFAYYNTERRFPGAPTAANITLSELILESRYAHDEVLIETENRRRAVGLMRWPVFVFRYTLGANQLFGSDFKYQKFAFITTQSLQVGIFGRADYRIEAGYIPSTVPYPLLKTHMGNQSPFYNGAAFNLMRYFEFVSDRYASVRVEDHFEGLLLNSLPLLRKLNWRLLASGNVLFGGVSQANRNLTPARNPATGEAQPTFQALDRGPYAEVGYGVENIFKVVRLDFLHRLTYRSAPEADNFGVKLSLQFKL
ncbi:DUF5686 and carboxypeptidase regulatory-like domain-containing protein [Hymenobacter sp. BT635]|uniref:DUF5686 and carboxypeptidase regulatory-like domain-containing protein n=1 Tax=Hymenobacter nitidus TaxID=2880929 RepID=A0ABS8ADL7_9BACT|nr:DUF5686 and carboxypeptidase-like regulatory domain-containing protein [Hymenobacter nitidus]MCB2378508.1 DUF5686 and carboxypeptidase regulatory-like domain-containing protein [Hymenobacter nitidus]